MSPISWRRIVANSGASLTGARRRSRETAYVRVVSYARVSTLAQESEGQSLPNQERVFARWIERSGAVRVRAYREAASAGTVEGRAEFSRMIDELPTTKPDAIVVDTLDRFTRSLLDGLHLLEQLRGHKVGLLPLDWRRERPIDVDDDRDWDDVVQEFTGAERERRRIRRRIVRAYEGRRERGATVTNRPPFGLLKQGDHLVPDPERIWIIREVERMALEGTAFATIAQWARSVDPTAWKTRAGPRQAIGNPSFLAAGARTPERQAELDASLADNVLRFGKLKTMHPHVFAGIFVCGICVDGGYAPERSVMTGAWQKGLERIVCAHMQNVDDRGHSFYCDARLVVDQWSRYIRALANDDDAVDRWASTLEALPDRRKLERSLAQLDQRVAALSDRRDRALDLLSDPNPAVGRQVRRALTQVDADEAALVATREALLGQIAQLERPRRDPRHLRNLLTAFPDIYADQESLSAKSALARALVDAIGGRPELRRIGPGGRGQRYDVAMSWPVVDNLELSGPVFRVSRRIVT